MNGEKCQVLEHEIAGLVLSSRREKLDALKLPHVDVFVTLVGVGDYEPRTRHILVVRLKFRLLVAGGKTITSNVQSVERRSVLELNRKRISRALAEATNRCDLVNPYRPLRGTALGSHKEGVRVKLTPCVTSNCGYHDLTSSVVLERDFGSEWRDMTVLLLDLQLLCWTDNGKIAMQLTIRQPREILIEPPHSTFAARNREEYSKKQADRKIRQTHASSIRAADGQN